MKNIITNALITMGYRKTDKDIFMKPVGFGVLVANILSNAYVGVSVVIKLLIKHTQNGETLTWSTKDFSYPSNFISRVKKELKLTEEEIYNKTCEEIARIEATIGIEHINIQYKNETFAFKTANDVNQIIEV